jgi:hypothetical protein
MRRERMACIAVLTTVAGCSTLSGARPLEPGRHELGVVLGGPVAELFGAPIPFPNVVVGGRSGLGRIADRPFDLGYGLNATALPFGVVAAHGDLGWLAYDQHGAAPAITVRNRLFLATNLPAAGFKEGSPAGAWGADQLELITSWKLDEHVVYAAVGQALDFKRPGLLITPALGASIDPGDVGGLRFQLEARWWAVNRLHDLSLIQWVPGTPGAIGIHLGVAWGFGEAR